MVNRVNLNSYYFFDGIRSQATVKGARLIRDFAKQLAEGDFIDSYRIFRTEDSVEISFQDRPQING
jgi:hypothetical protein